jgi:preprotein translocase subunit SecG
MYSILVTIALIISFLLIVIVLMQSSKGGGLAGTFGGTGQFGTMFGSRRTADFLSKSTWWLAGALIVLAILINLFFLPGKSAVTERESVIQGSGEQSVPATPVLPQQSTEQPNQ